MGLKYWIGKHEQTVVIIISILFMIPFLLMAVNFGGDSYDTLLIHYNLTANPGFVNVTETYDISVAGSYQVLYRSFRDSAKLDSTINENFPFNGLRITSVSCSRGSPYYADARGILFNPYTSLPIQPTVPSSKFETNEVGCYYLSGYSKTTEKLSISYLIPNSVLEKKNNIHTIFNQKHFPIQKLVVTGLGNKLSAKKLGPNSVIGINIAKKQILEEKNLGNWIFYLFALIGLIVPFLIWSIFGKEKTFVVPKYLHTTPGKNLVPWQVDTLTNGSGQMGKNGIASLFLELETLKLMTVKEKKSFLTKKYTFTIKKDYATILANRPKLREFVNELKEIQVTETDTDFVCEIQSGDKDFGMRMKKFVSVPSFKKKIMTFTGDHLFTFFVVLYVFSLILIGGAAGGSMFVINIMFFLAIIIRVSIPKSIFSRFKEDYYKQYLEWVAFNAMLNDFAQIKTYLKEDYNQWKDWLLYATAMGSADKVLKSLKELNIITAMDYDHYQSYNAMTLGFVLASTATTSSGGMGGAGGGFGGGGGGGR